MKFKTALAALIFSALTTASAQASSVSPEIGFRMTTQGGDFVRFILSNDSTAGITLDQFTFTIGDLSYNFDAVTLGENPAGGTATSKSPDAVNNVIRSDFIALDFTGFDSSESAEFFAEIDRDGAPNSSEDYMTVFFNNGAAPNSIATAFFSNGHSLSLTLPDNPTNFQFSASAVVPLPAALPLFVAGLAGLGIAARRRKNRA